MGFPLVFLLSLSRGKFMKLLNISANCMRARAVSLKAEGDTISSSPHLLPVPLAAFTSVQAYLSVY